MHEDDLANFWLVTGPSRAILGVVTEYANNREIKPSKIFRQALDHLPERESMFV